MFIVRVSDSLHVPVIIEQVVDADYKIITLKRYFFNWKLERKKSVYKLRPEGQNDILGLISLDYFDEEQRIEIRLLAVSADNMGREKIYDKITGNLIAFAAKQAVKQYGPHAAISLVPKTLLRQYYMDKYGFEEAGKSLFMEGRTLWKLLNEYGYDN